MGGGETNNVRPSDGADNIKSNLLIGKEEEEKEEEERRGQQLRHWEQKHGEGEREKERKERGGGFHHERLGTERLSSFFLLLLPFPYSTIVLASVAACPYSQETREEEEEDRKRSKNPILSVH